MAQNFIMIPRSTRSSLEECHHASGGLDLRDVRLGDGSASRIPRNRVTTSSKVSTWTSAGAFRNNSKLRASSVRSEAALPASRSYRRFQLWKTVRLGPQAGKTPSRIVLDIQGLGRCRRCSPYRAKGPTRPVAAGADRRHRRLDRYQGHIAGQRVAHELIDFTTADVLNTLSADLRFLLKQHCGEPVSWEKTHAFRASSFWPMAFVGDVVARVPLTNSESSFEGSRRCTRPAAGMLLPPRPRGRPS
jgi:hypothetical protein